jgi:lipopolysaccharide/colanic/teichoic acid biosynthesis glycosyltransferase
MHMGNLNKVDFYKRTLGFKSANKNVGNSKTLIKKDFEIETVKDDLLELIVNEKRINDIRYLNKYFEKVNGTLKKGGVFKGNVETYSVRRTRILNKFPGPFNKIYLFFDILLVRVSPKLWITKNLYFNITKGKGRVLSKAETYGRLYSCGFEITEEVYINNKIYFTVKKVKEPEYDMNPSYGFLIKLKRVGQHGKPIKVYKIRTMRPYSEYLQEYVFQKNNLQDGGKINNDFRISPEGKILRKLWVDELPMFYNFFKREMKLVGVRPLSAHYFSLYTKELQTLRIKTKPGLIPPFYADMPVTLEEIMASEIKYLKAYEKRPIHTDFSYFFKAINNILIKRKRSG